MPHTAMRSTSGLAAPGRGLQRQLVFDHRDAIDHPEATRGGSLHQFGPACGDDIDDEAGVVEPFIEADVEAGEMVAEFRRQRFNRPRRLVEDSQPLQSGRGKRMADRAARTTRPDHDTTALGIENEFGVPEPPERVHWDEDLARAVGVPAPYDYGPERVAWLGHLVTNWMGDDGFLARLNVQVRRHNLIGDTTWCRGRVAAKAVVDERGEVTLDLVAVNQRDETIAQGQAVLVLPRRSA